MEASVRINHVSLCNRSSDQAESFFNGILGLERLYEFDLPAHITRKIFGIAQTYRVLVYGNQRMKIEVFICPNGALSAPAPLHICLELADPDETIRLAQAAGLDTIILQRQDHRTRFIKDFDGNIFELKSIQKPENSHAPHRSV